MRRMNVLLLGFFGWSVVGCAHEESRVDEDGVDDEAALRSEHAGARALLDAVQTHAFPTFIECRTAAGVSPRLELRFDSFRSGPAVIRVKSRAQGVTSEWSTVGTLDGIPRAGDLQGTIAFTLGNESVSFDYFVEGRDDVNELVFAGKKIPLVCNTR